MILFLVSLPPGGSGGGWWRISESTLSGISATARRRIGQSPEKEQNFLYHVHDSTLLYIGHTAPKERNTKALASSEDSAFVAITQPAAGKHVFLRATSAITTVMLSMTSEDAKEQKAAKKKKKSPAYAGKKTISGRRPLDSSQKLLSNSPQGERKPMHPSLTH